MVPMSKRVQTLLEHDFALHEKWFVWARQVQKIVKKVANKAKLTQEVTPHVLRHTFATSALQKGISLAAVQKILGHDRLTTTAIFWILPMGILSRNLKKNGKWQNNVAEITWFILARYT